MPGKSCKRPLRKTRCEHNAVNCDFSLKMMAAYFFIVLWAKGFRTKSCSNVRTKWSNRESQIVQANMNVRIATTLPSDKVNILDIY